MKPRMQMGVRAATITVALCAWIGAAAAQSPEDAILDGDNGATGLLEKKPAEEQVLDDPDPKLIEALNKKREGIEAFINSYQEKFSKERLLEVKLGKRLKKISDDFDKLTAEALKAGDDFALKHNPLLSEYRTALQEDRGPDVKKAAKAIDALRRGYEKSLNKLDARATKIKAEFDKIEPELDAAAEPEAAPKPEDE